MKQTAKNTAETGGASHGNLGPRNGCAGSSTKVRRGRLAQRRERERLALSMEVRAHRQFQAWEVRKTMISTIAHAGPGINEADCEKHGRDRRRTSRPFGPRDGLHCQFYEGPTRAARAGTRARKACSVASPSGLLRANSEIGISTPSGGERGKGPVGFASVPLMFFLHARGPRRRNRSFCGSAPRHRPS
jgi:hypothetical protein